MADIAIFRINYKSDFILTLNSDAGWMTPFCIKFWTGAPSQAYFAGYDGTTYTHCAPVEGDPTKLVVQFDDHHLPVGDLTFQIGYHFTVADFPTSVEDEVLNQASVIIEQDGEPAQVMLDFNGETAPEIEFSLPAYANEAQRITNEQARIEAEQQRIANEDARIQAEETRQQNEQQRIAHETNRINEFATLKSQSQAATSAANAAATLANEKAQLAADKAALAQAAATLANDKAQLAADKAALAQAAATLANDKAALAQQKAAYAQTQGDYAKAQGDYAKAQGDTAQADHERAEADHATAASDHSRAESDHTTAASDHSRAETDHTTAASDHSRAETDHTTAASDHSRAESDHTTAAADHSRAESDHTTAAADHETAASDHTRAESDHAAVEVYVDSLGAFDISSYHATGGVLAKYADLSAALGTDGANIPEGICKGGMSVKFVQSSDNKYVQYRLMADEFSTTEADWQGVDDEPIAGSDNLVKSGGVFQELYINQYNSLEVSLTHEKKFINGTTYTENSYDGYNVILFDVALLQKVHIEISGAVNSSDVLLYGFYSSNEIIRANYLNIGVTSINTYNETVDVPNGATILAITTKDNGQTTLVSSVDLSEKYQEKLVSGSNIKTVGGNSLIGSGDVPFPAPTVIVDNLTEGGSTKALSAEQGKNINNRLSDVEDEVFEQVEKQSSLSSTSIEEGKFILHTGTISSNQDYDIYVYDVQNISKVRIVGVTNLVADTLLEYAFYSATPFSTSTLVLKGPVYNGDYDYTVNVPEGANYLVCTKSNSQTLSVYKIETLAESRLIGVAYSPIKYLIDGQNIYLAKQYGDKDIVIKLGPHTNGNGLFDFLYIYKQNHSDSINISELTRLLYNGSDWFGPYVILAKNNIDGDDVGNDTFTGGGHQYNNQTSGSTPTARLASLAFYIDGILTTQGSGFANHVKLCWTNFIQAANTKKSDGSGREVLKETITLSFNGLHWDAFNEIYPLEDITINTYYGYEFNSIGTLFTHWRYINATNRGVDNDSSGNKNVAAIIAEGSSVKLQMWLDENVDLGKRDFVQNNSDGAFRSDTKCYFRIANNNGDWNGDSYYYLSGKYIIDLL